jgi:hypothetical protein
MKFRSLLMVGPLAIMSTLGSVTAAPAFADGGHCIEDQCITNGAKAHGGDGKYTVEYGHGHSEQVTGRGDGSHGYAPGRTSWTEVEEGMAPTCYTNSRTNPDALCGAAVNTCPKGLIRFWVWHQVVEYTKTNGVTTSTITTPWYQEDGSFCLGADDPKVPTIAKVIDQIQSGFKDLPLSPPPVTSDPGPTTVVNLETAFSAGSTAPITFNPVLLGVTVHVTAKPIAWHWTWGDGQTQTTSMPGVPKQPVVTHTYSRVANVPVSVVVEYAGTFSVGADTTQYAVQDHATSPPSPPVIVHVREARSQLVSH